MSTRYNDWAVLRVKADIAAGLEDVEIGKRHNMGPDMVKHIREGTKYAEVTPEYAQERMDAKLEVLRARYRYFTESLKKCGEVV